MILGSRLRVAESIVSIAHEVNERRGAIRQVMGVGHILQERLLREPTHPARELHHAVVREMNVGRKPQADTYFTSHNDVQ